MAGKNDARLGCIFSAIEEVSERELADGGWGRKWDGYSVEEQE